MSDYTLTVGLEVHAELKTQTKMFCDSKNDTNETNPNTNVCPVCMGHPGTLPVINKEAVKFILRFGVAVEGELADYTEFDRKNYFYPDIPKGYQISQYKYPLVKGGELAGINLTRVHLEEDTARSTHDSRLTTNDYSLLDFNRAGVPLMELVTEPVIHSALDAANFAKELQLLLRYLGMSDANMEKGEMRVEANISVSKDKTLGTKVEVKNINSFKAVEKAIKYEFDRHVSLLDNGGKVEQETRGWDENKEETFSQRAKEDSHDYRYFPDPDLPKLFIKEIDEFDREVLKKSLPELPNQKRDRYKKKYDLKQEDIEVYLADVKKSKTLEEVAGILEDKELIQVASNYLLNVIEKEVRAEAISGVVKMISAGELSSKGAKEIFKLINETETDARKIAEENNLIQKSNKEELEKIAVKIISDNSKAVEEYKNGKTASLEFLIGQAMKETRGSANPQVLKEIFLKLL